MRKHRIYLSCNYLRKLDSRFRTEWQRYGFSAFLRNHQEFSVEDYQLSTDKSQLIVGVLSIELFLSECCSLKSKRRIVKSILDRIRSRFNVSVAEVGQQELWQRTVLGFVSVGSNRKVVERTLSKIADQVEDMGKGELIDIQMEIL